MERPDNSRTKKVNNNSTRTTKASRPNQSHQRTQPGADAPHPSAHHEAIVPVSIFAGLIGMLVGTLPPPVCILLVGVSFPPLYLFLPVIIWLMLRTFRGFTGVRGVLVASVFSILGLYLTLVASAAADSILRYHMSPFTLPFVTAAMIGRQGALPGPLFASAYVLPFVFTLIGMSFVYALLMYSKPKHKT